MSQELTKTEINHFYTIPQDVLVLILSYLKISDLIIVERVSKYLQKLAKDDRLWLLPLKKMDPNFAPKTDTPTNVSNKDLYKDYKSGTYLKKLFRANYPEVRLDAPKGIIETHGFVIKTPDELQSLCANGTEEEFKMRQSFLAREAKLCYMRVGFEGLANLLNLCIQNPNNKNAFKMLVESLGGFIKSILDKIYDKNYYYLILNALLHNIVAFEVQKNKPPVISFLENDLIRHQKKEKVDSTIAVKFLIAFDLKSLQATDYSQQTPFHIICKYPTRLGDLFLYFVNEVVHCNKEFLLTTDSRQKIPLHYLVNQLPDLAQLDPKFVQKALDAIIDLVQACPQILIKADGDNATILTALLSYHFYTHHYSENFWEVIDKELFKLKGETLLIRSLLEKIPNGEKMNFIDKFLATESKKEKKYIDYLYQGTSALHLACSPVSAQIEIVKKLLEMGASVDQLDTKGLNALTVAVTFNYHAIVELLLQNGANPNTLIHGVPILIIALEQQCDLEMFTILLKPEYKADPTIKSKGIHGKSALELSKPKYEIHQALKEAARKLGYNFLSKADLIKENEALRKQLSKFLNQDTKTINNDVEKHEEENSELVMKR